MQWQMECADRKWCDFVSYDPRMPVDLQLFIIRCDRDDAIISDISEAVVKLLAEVDDTIEQLDGLSAGDRAAVGQG